MPRTSLSTPTGQDVFPPVTRLSPKWAKPKGIDTRCLVSCSVTAIILMWPPMAWPEGLAGSSVPGSPPLNTGHLIWSGTRLRRPGRLAGQDAELQARAHLPACVGGGHALICPLGVRCVSVSGRGLFNIGGFQVLFKTHQKHIIVGRAWDVQPTGVTCPLWAPVPSSGGTGLSLRGQRKGSQRLLILPRFTPPFHVELSLVWGAAQESPPPSRRLRWGLARDEAQGARGAQGRPSPRGEAGWSTAVPGSRARVAPPVAGGSQVGGGAVPGSLF